MQPLHKQSMKIAANLYPQVMYIYMTMKVRIKGFQVLRFILEKNLNLLDMEYITIRFIFRFMSIKYIPLVGSPPLVLLEPMLFVFIRLTCLVGEYFHHLCFFLNPGKMKMCFQISRTAKVAFPAPLF